MIADGLSDLCSLIPIKVDNAGNVKLSKDSLDAIREIVRDEVMKALSDGVMLQAQTHQGIR